MRTLTLLIASCLVLFISCQEKERGPLVTNNEKPGILSNVSVENLHGGAKISYSLPDDPNILYVVAEFSTRNNEKRIVKSSVFKNFVVLDGFTKTEEQQVNLYTVTRSEKRSDPIKVKISPLEPPVDYIFQSLQVKADFGGVNISFFNEAENQYVLHTLIKDSTNTWVDYDRLYTSAKERNYSVHGLPAEPIDFAFYFMDKWQNYSDTLFETLTPLYEEELDKGLWQLYPLDNDTYAPLYSRPIDRIWDGSVSSSPYAINPSGAVLPSWLTIDLGQKALFSRFRFNAYYKSGATGWVFGKGTPSEFEVWGCTKDKPSPNGDWDDWTLLGSVKVVKPSGLPVGQLSNEDLAAAIAGQNLTFPYTGVAYRYIRFKTVDTWGKRPDVFFGEFTFWGQPQ